MSKGGRKSKYDPSSTPYLAEGYARDGYLDKQIAEMLGVRAATLCEWQKKYPKLSQALKRGRDAANRELKRAMLKTACGYEVEETELTAILDRDQTPKSYRKTVRKRHIPPNPTMQIFLAKNRMPDEFRDVNRHEVQLQGELKVKTLADLMMEELKNAGASAPPDD